MLFFVTRCFVCCLRCACLSCWLIFVFLLGDIGRGGVRGGRGCVFTMRCAGVAEVAFDNVSHLSLICFLRCGIVLYDSMPVGVA